MFKSAPPAGTYNVNVTVSGSDVLGNDNTWRLLEIEVTGQTTEDLVGDHFVTTWKTTGPSENIRFPASGDGTYTVMWGDGTAPETLSKSKAHGYSSPGIYTMSVYGDLWSIKLGSYRNSHAVKLQSIEQWGNIEWTTMNSAFYGASSMRYKANDVPDLSGVNDTSNMFRDATAFNGNLSSWDVSSVTNMTSMFRDATAFNGNLSSWDVSSVTDMTFMFNGASDFNQSLSNWNVSSVIDMERMFFSASDFDGDISNWNVSSVTRMYSMFESALAFNGNLSSWDVSSVTDMTFMFYGASAFNGDISNWKRLLCHRHVRHVRRRLLIRSKSWKLVRGACRHHLRRLR